MPGRGSLTAIPCRSFAANIGRQHSLPVKWYLEVTTNFDADVAQEVQLVA